MNNPIEQTRDLIDLIIKFIEPSPWKGIYLNKLNNLKTQLDNPCVLAVAGRVKAGKSSFINALLGKDLATTGVTETTATINIFKYGFPEDETKPVCCVWANGRRTWESKTFLDSLQGNDKETLMKAEGISHLEFYIPDPILKDVTLVDTPGTDAIVGEDDDGHQKVTEEFFRLRERHSKETKERTEQADAVIYLTGQVANVSNQTFLQEFMGATGGNSSAMNAIGVMAKIDISDSIIQQRHELASAVAEKLQRELNTVVPVSSGIWRALCELKKNNMLIPLQQRLREIPEKIFEFLLNSDRTFSHDSSTLAKVFKLQSTDEIPDVETRLKLKGDMPWRVFVVIATHLYRFSAEEAETRLVDISGMNTVKKLLETHFFQRGRLLRSYRIVNELGSVLREIQVNGLYELRKEAKMKNELRGFVLSHPQNAQKKPLVDMMLSLIEQNVKNENEIDSIEKILNDKIIPSVEQIQLRLQDVDSKFHALQLIESSPKEFSDSEKSELYKLFGMYGLQEEPLSTDICGARQQYWNLEYNLARSSVRRRVAEYAITCYGS